MTTVELPPRMVALLPLLLLLLLLSEPLLLRALEPEFGCAEKAAPGRRLGESETDGAKEGAEEGALLTMVGAGEGSDKEEGCDLHRRMLGGRGTSVGDPAVAKPEGREVGRNDGGVVTGGVTTAGLATAGAANSGSPELGNTSGNDCNCC